MFHLNTTTVLLLHEDRVNHLQKMHEPLSLLNRWNVWRKPQSLKNASTFKKVIRHGSDKRSYSQDCS